MQLASSTKSSPHGGHLSSRSDAETALVVSLPIISPRPMMNWTRFFPALTIAHRSLGTLMTSRPDQHRTPTDCRATTLCRGAVALLLVVGLGLAGSLQVSSASAQSSPQSPSNPSEENESPLWTHFDQQITHALRQEPSMRAAHIQVVIEATAEAERVDLSRTVWALVDVIKHDSNPTHRLMAVQALHRINPEHVGQKQYRQAMSRLHALTQGELPEPVRTAAQRTLSRYATAS